MISMLIKERCSLTGKPYPKRLIFKVVGYCSSIVGKARVNRIMRENNLLSPNRRARKASKREHDGTIITDSPNSMLATDRKKFWIDGLGWHWFFGVIDHFNDESTIKKRPWVTI
jgi:hypothetical protein